MTERLDSAAPPEMNPSARVARRARTPLGFVSESLLMGWRWLRRMRTALYLLAALGVLTMVATVVPQSPNVPRTVAAWRSGEEGPGTLVSDVLLEPLGAYDLYGAPIFLLLLFALFLSLTACMVPRVRAWVRLVRHSRPPHSRDLSVHDETASFTTSLGVEAAEAAVRSRFAERRWRVRSDSTAPRGAPVGSLQVAAEKGHWSREGGSLVFHLSFYVLLVAVVLGQLLGFQGQVGLVEGEETFTDTRIAYWSYQPGRWWGPEDHPGFGMVVDEFIVDWHRDPQLGARPKTFLADLAVTPPDGTDPYVERVGGNDPVTVDGMKMHLLDWGYAPRVVVEVDGEVVHDGFITMQLTEEALYQGVVKVPSVEPDIGLDLALWPYAPPGEDGRPVLTGAPWAEAPFIAYAQLRGDLGLDGPQRVDTLDLDGLTEDGGGAMRLGQPFESGGVTVTVPELRRWVGMQMSYRPTVPWLLLGAGMLLAGLVPALYAYRRRGWVQLEPRADGTTQVHVAGRAFQRPQAFADEFDDLRRELERDLSADDSDDAEPSTPAPAPRAPAGTPA